LNLGSKQNRYFFHLVVELNVVLEDHECSELAVLVFELPAIELLVPAHFGVEAGHGDIAAPDFAGVSSAYLNRLVVDAVDQDETF
jgi:hypothetical protein